MRDVTWACMGTHQPTRTPMQWAALLTYELQNSVFLPVFCTFSSTACAVTVPRTVTFCSSRHTSNDSTPACGIETGRLRWPGPLNVCAAARHARAPHPHTHTPSIWPSTRHSVGAARAGHLSTETHLRAQPGTAYAARIGGIRNKTEKNHGAGNRTGTQPSPAEYAPVSIQR
jgi:hypothetical protein